MINKHLSSSFSVLCTRLGASTTSLWAQNTAKLASKAPFLHAFSNHTFLCRVLWPWIAWGTLVVINNDEWDHFEAFSTLSSPFNAPFWHNRVVFSVHSARARVGSRGSSVGPKMVQNYFFHLGCSNNCFWPVLSPWWPVLTLQNSQKALKMDFRFSSSKQQQQAGSSTREMGKNQNSLVVLRIRLNFWWMIPMSVKYNHTEFEQETQRWRPGTGFASALWC